MKPIRSLSVVGLCLYLTVALIGKLPEAVAGQQYSVPTLENLFKEGRAWYGMDEIFHACVFRVDYGEEGLLTQKKSVDNVRVGTRTGYLDVYHWNDLTEGDLDLPNLGDCYFFIVDSLRIIFIYPEDESHPLIPYGIGMVSIVEGPYTIDSTTKKIERKTNLTVTEYCNANVGYSGPVITLTGMVRNLSMKVDWSGDVLMIEFDDGRGCHIDALLPKKYWKNSEDLKTRLRNINIGDQLTVEGVFDVDNRINALMRLDSVIW